MFKAVAESFGYTDENIKKVIKETSQKTGESEEKVRDVLEDALQKTQTKCIERSKLKLKDYQTRAVQHMQINRGLIISFGVGSGKTLTAVSILACLKAQAKFFNKKIKIIVVTPTSLQTNFKKEMQAYGMSEGSINHVQFYTIASFANALTRNELVCDHNTLLIIDEAHEFKKDYRGEFSTIGISKGDTDTRAYKAITCAKKVWKTVLLTATPLYNAPHDIVNLVAMAKGKSPMTFSEFHKSIQDSDTLREYYGCVFSFYTPPQENYPTLNTKLALIDMSNDYNRNYNNIMYRIGSKKRQKLLTKVGYRAEDWTKRRTKTPGESEEVKNSFMIALRKASNDLEPCQKCDYVMDIVKSGEKTIIFSEFITSGIDILKKKFDDAKIKYLEIKGNVSKAKRDQIVKDINDPDPKKPTVLFITKAGGQGLDLKRIKHVILFEVGWTESTADQVIGRARRYKSHDDLPENQRNVTVHRLMTITREDRQLLQSVNNDFVKLLVRYKDLASADLYLYLYSMKKRMETDAIQERLEKIDINHMKC